MHIATPVHTPFTRTYGSAARDLSFRSAQSDDEADESIENHESPPPSTSVTPVSRPSWSTAPPGWLQDYRLFVAHAAREPTTFKQVLGLPDTEKAKWFASMDSELQSLISKEVFAPCLHMPHDRTTVGLKWVYKIKYLPDGSVEHYKSRLVAQGFTQRPGLDFDENFAPTARIESVRLVSSLACANNWSLHQVDIKTAYLNAPLDKDVLCVAPVGFVCLWALQRASSCSIKHCNSYWLYHNPWY
jgi:histone deacetylase 1/2